MEIIAHKKRGIGLMYAFTLLLSLFMFLYAVFSRDNPALIIIYLGALTIAVISLVIVIQYIKTPNEAIIYDESKNEIRLPSDVIIQVSDIVDLSYRRASAKGIQYKWGSVVIKTITNRYIVRYLANCEAVCKRLIELKYMHS